MHYVSVIIPCRNEIRFIDALLKTLNSQDWPIDKVEWIIVDGVSDDGTREHLLKSLGNYPALKVLDNLAKYVPQALNMAILQAKGDVIVRMDAHSGYPVDYISRLVRALDEHNADNTGGVWITQPGANTTEAMAIALATSHPLGIGNASYRLGADRPKEVDTVPYGCFRRDVFTRFGMFDEDMIRNQDDELNARIVKGGGKILLLPDVFIEYHARETVMKMSSMFYQYGLFKPLVNLKVGSPATLRQFAPPILVLGSLLVITLLILGLLSWKLFGIMLALYLFPVFLVAIIISTRKGLNLLGWLCICFPAIHFSYGWGYLKGFLKFALIKNHNTGVNDNR
jgi:glycosyltransferase involved in cell wall biosynthesis